MVVVRAYVRMRVLTVRPEKLEWNSSWLKTVNWTTNDEKINISTLLYNGVSL